MNLLSGLLLTGVVLFILGFVLWELFGDRAAAAYARRSQTSAKGVNEHLIGSIGRVIEGPEDESGLLRVRIGAENWSARLRRRDADQPALGAEVKITDVDGLVLEIEARGPAD
jgi:membrane protein implicated in regulation of membrane protease activity